MGIFYIKARDVNPVLEVALKNPDGTAHDLTGSTGWKLHILLSNGTKLIRTMAKQGLDTAGVLRYQWVATDWDAASGTPVDGAFPVGGLVASPGTLGANGIILAPGAIEHRMEYEVVGPSPARLTFPNDGYDVLRIIGDIGQGT